MRLNIASALPLRRWSSFMWRCHTPSFRLASGAHVRFSLDFTPARRLPSHHALRIALAFTLAAFLPAEDLAPAEAAAVLSSPPGSRAAQLARLAHRQGPGIEALATALVAAPDPRERQAALTFVLRQPPDCAGRVARKLIADADAQRRRRGLDILAKLGGEPSAQAAFAAAVDRAPEVRLAAAQALAVLPGVPVDPGGSGTAPTLARLLLDDDLRVVLAAIAAAAVHRDLPGLRDRLFERLAAGPEPVITAAAEHLGAAGMSAREFAPVLLALAGSSAPEALRAAAAETLGGIGDESVVVALLELLGRTTTDQVQLRCAICQAIGHISPARQDLPPRIERALAPLARSDRWRATRQAASWALLRAGSPIGLQTLIAEIGGELNDEAADLLQGATGLTLPDRQAWEAWWKKTGRFQPVRVPPLPAGEAEVEFAYLRDRVASVAFVIDISGSMNDVFGQGANRQSKLGLVRKEMRRSLRTLGLLTAFNVIYFNDEPHPWQAAPVRAGFRNRTLALERILSQGCARGTNIHGALAQALAQPGIQATFLLTDGQPTIGLTDANDILAAIASANRERERPTRVHAIAFHVDTSERATATRLLSALAREHDGTYREIE